MGRGQMLVNYHNLLVQAPAVDRIGKFLLDWKRATIWGISSSFCQPGKKLKFAFGEDSSCSERAFFYYQVPTLYFGKTFIDSQETQP